MSYTTKQAMIDRFGEDELLDATDRLNTGAIDDEVLSRAIEDAAVDINRYLGSRYALPVEDSTGALTRIASDLARYYLWGTRAPEQIAKRYEAATSTLRDYARGVISLEAKPTTAKRQGTVAVVAQGQVFDGAALQRIGL